MGENLALLLGKSIDADKRHIGIYPVGQDAIAKVGFNGAIRHEFDIGSYLFREGIAVPEIYELIEAERVQRYCDKPINKNNWYIIMQKIKGRERGLLFGKDKKEADKQIKEEVEKVLGLGILPYDCFNGWNSIFRFDIRKLFLIDFAAWEKGCSAYELNHFRERLKANIKPSD